ncbi:PEBP-like protein [Bimuria novae-zelandiae CBS 107.79]|uniref:Large ribosomal subunit protein mL38 n=1 Tax=Bimuria novae-zelandiae CBS 107.79 TaxID=1447943 RepID=A0A6A5UVP2_9PLEO|nr:PEBP-like protein [Bimuria novae-zelandiae CBS 107.79]
MAPVKPSVRQFSACFRSVRGDASFNGAPRRFLSSSVAAREELQTTTPSTPPPPPPAAATPVGPSKDEAVPKEIPEYMQKWGELDPNAVEQKRDERRLVRREGIQPIGSRRRRAIIARTSAAKAEQVPFEQLPYQCFQEARKVLLADREEKLKEIKTQMLRIENLKAQDPAVSGSEAQKETRLRSMQNHLNDLVILADINDPMVKKKFEDGMGDMNKPIYRYLAEQKWRKYKRLVLEQRIEQFNLVPDLLPALNPIVDIDLAFGRKNIPAGDFVDSAISENPPRLNVQTFERGQKLVTVVVVDADVPVPEKDSFTYRCHFIASNISIAPDQTSIPFTTLQQQSTKAEKAGNVEEQKVALSWSPPWAHKGAPYHRMAIFVLEQKDAQPLNISKIKSEKRDGFILRSFVDRMKLKPIGATLFRTKWDESMEGIMKRHGLEDEINVEFKRKRIDPLPYKKRTERMR